MSTFEEESQTKKTFCCKILVIGDPGTGKTSIIRRFVHGVFNNNYRATIGVDFALKIIVVDEKQVHLQMWDIAGQDRYGVMTRVYYKDAHGAVIVLDATREGTHEGALRWKTDLDSKVTLANGNKVPAILLANKHDLDNNLSDEELQEIEENGGFLRSFRTSAKDNSNIDEAFKFLAQCVLNTERGGHYDMPTYNQESRPFKLSGDIASRPKRRSNSCCSVL